MKTNLTNSIHIFLAHKGGVGKTTMAALTAEWMINAGAPPIVYDADARNVDACIAQYKLLNARRLDNLLKTRADGTQAVNEAGFEALLESLAGEDGPHIVDTGANTYTNWISYVQEMDLASVFEDSGRTVYVHTIISGGEMCEETVRGLEEIAQMMPTWKLVVWVNEFASPAKLKGGEHFLESKRFVAVADHIHYIIRMRELTPVLRQALDQLGPLRLLRSQC